MYHDIPISLVCIIYLIGIKGFDDPVLPVSNDMRSVCGYVGRYIESFGLYIGGYIESLGLYIGGYIESVSVQCLVCR